MNEPNDFWGDVPDWTGEVPRQKRGARRSPADRGGATGRSGSLKKWWSSALVAGAQPTREHRVLDARAPRPGSAAAGADDLTDPIARQDDVDPFFDLDIDTVSDRFPLRGDTGTTAASDGDDGGWLDRVWHDTASDGDADRTGAPAFSAHDDVDLGRDGGFVDHEPADDGVHDEMVGAGSVVPPPRGGVDPLLARIGGVAVVLSLIVPLVIGLRSSDGDDLLAGAPVETVADSTAPTSAPASPLTDVASSTGDEVVDVSDLPLAVPVNTDPASAGTSPVAVETSVARASTSDETSTSSTSSDDSDDRAQSASEELSDASSSSEATSASEASTDSTPSVTSISGPAAVDDGAERATPACAVDYEVVSGDYWLRLVDAADVSLADLLAVNDATVDSPLYPGLVICLPAGARTPTPPAAPATTSAPATTPSTQAPLTTTATTTPATTTPATTSPATTTPSTQAPAVDTSPAGPEEIKQIIRDVWPDDLEDRALEIAFRESRFDPRAKNYCCYGLFQMYWSVHRGWLADLGITSDQQLYDPRTNARAALALYERSGGWGPWGF